MFSSSFAETLKHFIHGKERATKSIPGCSGVPEVGNSYGPVWSHQHYELVPNTHYVIETGTKEMQISRPGKQPC